MRYNKSVARSCKNSEKEVKGMNLWMEIKEAIEFLANLVTIVSAIAIVIKKRKKR